MPVSPVVNEIDHDNSDRASRQRREATTTNTEAGGKRHYVIDYFVIVDYAIYNRCDVVAYATSYPSTSKSTSSSVKRTGNRVLTQSVRPLDNLQTFLKRAICNFVWLTIALLLTEKQILFDSNSFFCNNAFGGWLHVFICD